MIFKTDSAVIASDELKTLVKDFLTLEQPRREKLYSFYQGEQPVKKGRVAAGRPNNTLVANYAKYITDVHTGYFMGVPPTFTFTGRRNQERMLSALEDASISSLLFSAARDMSIFGESYVLAYLTAKGVRAVVLDPRETFVVTGGVENIPVAAVRVKTTRNSYSLGELYQAGVVQTWEFDGRNSMTLSAVKPLAFKAMPVCQFRNNLGLLGDFEPVLSLIDAYNLLLSGSMDDMQSVANAFLALYGMQGTTREDIERANITRVLSLAENGKAEFVVKNLNPDAVSLLRETLINDMLMITMTPNLNDEAFGSQSSGVALEYKLWGAEQARSAKEKGFSPGLYHLISLFFEGMKVLGTPVTSQCTARFYKNLPQDLTRLCENINTLNGVISRRTKLELLPFINDADVEMSRISEEEGR